MNPKTLFGVLLCLMIASPALVSAQTIETRGRLSNSTYVYQDRDTTHVRLYQYIRFQAISHELNNLSLNVDARVLSDLEETLPDEYRYNAFRLSVSATDLFNNLLDFEIGRQFLHPGVTFGSLDGLNLIFKFSPRVCWQVYGGVQSNLFSGFKIYKPDEAAVYGSTLKYRNFYDTNIELAYLRQQTKDAVQWEIAGLNLTNSSITNIYFTGQFHYDIVNSRLHRVFVSGRYMPAERFSAVLSYKQQFPQIFGDSYFQIFTFEKYRQAGLNLWYSLTERFGVAVDYHLIMLEEGKGNRIIASIMDRNGSLGVVYETGDLGDQLSLLLNYGYEFMDGLIGSVSVDYTRYRFEEGYDFENQMGNTARLAYRLSPNWQIDLEYQWLNNKFKDSDHRLLNHIHFIW